MCEKIAYKTEKQASTAMNTIRKHDRTRNSNEIPKRVYWCSECKNFHLTHYLKP